MRSWERIIYVYMYTYIFIFILIHTYIHTWQTHTTLTHTYEIIAENLINMVKFPKQMFTDPKNLRFQIGIKSKKTTFRHIIIKLLKNKQKGNLLKVLEKDEKLQWFQIFPQKPLWLKDSRTTSLKCLKKRTVDLEFCIHWKCLLQVKWK